jgi:superoxide dismutase, Cu-Zn family
MRLPLLAAGLTALPLLAACDPATPSAEAPATKAPAVATAAPAGPVRSAVGATARASLVNSEGAAAGTAILRQGSTGVVIRVEATGLTPGWHGLHLHAVGQCQTPFDSAGAHIQHAGQKVPHGYLNAQGPDSGDLPNLYVGADGRGFAEVFTTVAALNQGGPGEHLLDADGSSILIHANADDHSTQPIGGAGDRVLCGVIAAG